MRVTQFWKDWDNNILKWYGQQHIEMVWTRSTHGG